MKELERSSLDEGIVRFLDAFKVPLRVEPGIKTQMISLKRFLDTENEITKGRKGKLVEVADLVNNKLKEDYGGEVFYTVSEKMPLENAKIHSDSCIWYNFNFFNPDFLLGNRVPWNFNLGNLSFRTYGSHVCYYEDEDFRYEPYFRNFSEILKRDLLDILKEYHSDDQYEGLINAGSLSGSSLIYSWV